MNHKNAYDILISRSKNRQLERGTLYEKHHIVPKCIGGNDDNDNIVSLTIREHFVAHLLLEKIYPENKSLQRAVSVFTNGRKGYLTSSEFETSRKFLHTSNIMNEPGMGKYCAARRKYSIENPKFCKVCTKKMSAYSGYTCSRKCFDVYVKMPNNLASKNMSKSASKFLKTLSKEEMVSRMSKSAWSVDSVERGRAISKGKNKQWSVLVIIYVNNKFEYAGMIRAGNCLSETGYSWARIKTKFSKGPHNMYGIKATMNVIKIIQWKPFEEQQ